MDFHRLEATQSVEYKDYFIVILKDGMVIAYYWQVELKH